MADVILNGSVRIPGWVGDLESFRRWVHADAFPASGWFGYVAGDLWADLNPEGFDHNEAKSEVRTVLATETKAEEQGLLCGRMLVTHREAKLATKPDAFFFTKEARERGRVRLEHGQESIQVLGTPD